MKTQQHSDNIRHFVGTVVLCVSFIGAVAGSIATAEPDTNNKAEAFKWYLKAAEQGNARAQDNLGMCYLEGEVVEENMAEEVLRMLGL